MKRSPDGPVLSSHEPDDSPHSKLASPAEVRAMLVIRAGGLGDLILTLPCLEALRRRWPGAFVEILGHPSIASIALNRFQADRVTSIDRSLFARLFQTASRLDAQLNEYLSQFDLVVSFLPDSDGTMQRNLTSAVRNVVIIPPPRPGSHASLQFLQSLGFTDPNSDSVRPTVYLEQRHRDRGEEVLLAAGVGFPPRIVIHPGSGSERKNWPAECFGDVARRLSEARTHVVFLEGEADGSQTGRAVAASGGRPPVISRLSVKEAAGVLSVCQLLLGNDSGISHLAAAVGIPVISIFGPTDPEMWRPLGARVDVIRFSEADPRLVATRALEVVFSGT